MRFRLSLRRRRPIATVVREPTPSTTVRQDVSVQNVRAEGDVNIYPSIVLSHQSVDERELAEVLISDPLRILGVAEEFAEAKREREVGDHAGAAHRLLAASKVISDRGYDALAEIVTEEAADALKEAGHLETSASIREGLVRARLGRADRQAELAARKLIEVLPPQSEWRGEGLLARAVWPEHPNEAVQALAAAAEAAAGGADELEFGTAYVEVLLHLGRFAEARTAAETLRGRLGPVQADSSNERIALELDYLDAASRAGADPAEVESDWQQLTNTLEQAQAAVEPARMAWVWQRRGVSLGQSDRFEEARAAFVRAIKEWNREPGNEEQIKEVFFSLERLTMLSGVWRGQTFQIRGYAYRLRGRKDSQATLAERLEREGLHARLADERLPDALRAFWHAYGVSRVAGNFYEQTTAAELIAGVFEAAGRPGEALPLLIEAGKEKQAKKLAPDAGAAASVGSLRLNGPIWERTVSFAVLRAIGGSLSDDDVATLAPVLLDAAREDPQSVMWPQPSRGARDALAAMAAAIPDELLAESCDIFASDRTVNASSCLEALVVLTNLGRVDETERICDVCLDPDFPNPGKFVVWVGTRLPNYPDLHPLFREAAVAGNRWALEALAIAELLVDEKSLVERVDRDIEAFLRHRPYEETVENGTVTRTIHMGDQSGIGITARYCSTHLRRPLVERLLANVSDSRDAGTNRSGAAHALYNLAGVLDTDEVQLALPTLIGIAAGESEGAESELGHHDDPLARSRIRFHVPGVLRGAALETASRLVARTDGAVPSSDLERVLRLGLESGNDHVIAAAFAGYGWLPSVEMPIAFEDAIEHSDPEVRIAVLRAFNGRGALPPFADLAPLAIAEPDANVRAFYATLAAEAGSAGAAVAEALTDDSNTFVRWKARLMLESLRSS